MWCPFFPIRSLIIFLKLPTEARSASWGILAHSLRSDVFNKSTLVWATQETFVYSIDHTGKSIRFKSGDAWGHISLLQTLGKWRVHQSWVFIVVWDGAPSCWKMKWWFLKCFIISSKARTKILLILRSVLILTSFSTKIRGEFQDLETAAHTMSENGFCQQ